MKPIGHGLIAAFCAAALLLGGCRRQAAPPSPSPLETSSAVSAAAGSKEACKRCNGEWGLHGLAQIEGCLCRTGDVGKRCQDGIECQGDCLLVPGEVEVSDAGPPPRGFFIGRCAEFVTTFGCFARIADGARAAGPQPLDEVPPTVCTD